MNVLTQGRQYALRDQFLRLRTPVTIGSRFGEWEVTWLGGWTRDKLGYIVMVARTVAWPATDNVN